ncbi:MULTISPECIES: hypothetical protein [Bacillus]|uniref:hypothetical protein n=1 Tax=Bacillus TaxID=1386 RepID=UPI000BB6D1EB|nr:MULTISPECIES: hypothetical protein [Bacillus]
MEAFTIVHPVIETENELIIEFIDPHEPIESRKLRLTLDRNSKEVQKLIIYRPTVNLWQEITSMLSPFYLAALKNDLLAKLPVTSEEKLG